METSATSPFLYGLGLVASLSGVAAIDLSAQIPAVTVSTLSIVTVGFAFSYLMRVTKQDSRWLQAFCVAFSMFLLYGAIGPQVDQGQFGITSDQASVNASLVLASLASIWSWFLATNDRVVFCSVIALASIGLVVPAGLSDQLPACVVTFIVATILLLVHHNGLRLIHPTQLTAQGGRFAVGQLAIGSACSVLVLAVAFAAMGPTQTLLEQIPFVDTLHKITAAKPGGGNGNVFPVTIFSDDNTVDVGSGSDWPTSTEVLLRTESTDNNPHYWRGRTYDTYNGTGWSSSLVDQPVVASSSQREGGWDDYRFTPPTAPGRPRQTIFSSVSVRGTTGQFYIPGEPLSISFRYSRRGEITRTPDESYTWSDGVLLGMVYVLESIPEIDIDDPIVQNISVNNPNPIPLDVLRMYASLTPSNAVTADDISYFQLQARAALQAYPGHAKSEYQKVDAIERLVTSRCVYSLKIPPPDRRYDHVRNFLERTHKGYCDLFASSVAVLCRSIGIPTRLVTGFAPGVRNGKAYDIRASDKHAWLEVYFANLGWVRCDPTVLARTETSTTTASKSGIDRIAEWLSGLPPIPAWERAASSVIALLLCGVAWIEAKDKFKVRGRGGRRYRGIASAYDILYVRLQTAVVRATQIKIVGETPAELSVRARTAILPDIDEHSRSVVEAAIRSITDGYARQRYAEGVQTDLSDAAAAEAAMRTINSAVNRIRLRRTFGGLQGFIVRTKTQHGN